MPRPITEMYVAGPMMPRGSRDSSAYFGAISKPTHDQNEANMATPTAPIAVFESENISAGLIAFSGMPSAPPPSSVSTPKIMQAATSEMRHTPRMRAVSSMWKNASMPISPM